MLFLTALGVVVALFGLPPAYLGPEKAREWLWQAAKPTPVPEKVPTVNESISKPNDGSAVGGQLRYVGGNWISCPGNLYIFNQSGSHIDIYTDLPKEGQIKIGSGMVTQTGEIYATAQSPRDKRWAEITLRLSKDGQSLEGTFSGSAPHEKNFPLLLSREGQDKKVCSQPTAAFSS
jgi:hypothetical protein